MNLSVVIFGVSLLCVLVSTKHVQKKREDARALKMITTRVIGGYRATISEIGGFLVALVDKGDFFCGGSLIADLVVVTAAHCLVIRMARLKAVTVYGGISSLKSGGSNFVRVRKAILHGNYDERTSDNDVAIVKLSSPLTSSVVRPIKLCSTPPKDGDTLAVSGWGYTTNDEDKQDIMSDVRTVEVPFFNFKKCKRIYKDVNAITSNMMCAGKLGEKDACTFDSGGPLVFNGELCGIVSFGVGCADEVYPGVYTDVIAVMPWIQKMVTNL